MQAVTARDEALTVHPAIVHEPGVAPDGRGIGCAPDGRAEPAERRQKAPVQRLVDSHRCAVRGSDARSSQGTPSGEPSDTAPGLRNPATRQRTPVTLGGRPRPPTRVSARAPGPEPSALGDRESP
ncbi:hypothetical protein APASM_6368 [Actinosynnema pretiosum subsp. pretiosum]|nr:hypothetical protein APASM_6368 [Actinosynnema pretiosum subsp. pretiosum]